MPIRFDGESDSATEVGPKPPPDYSSRWMQVRLLTLVFALMLIIVAMFEARKPKYYRWMGFKDNNGQLADESNEQVDTRLRGGLPVGARRQGTVTIAEANGPDDNLDDQPSGSTDLLRRETVNAWSKVLKPLVSSDRQQLYKVLKSVRDEKSVVDGGPSRGVQVLKQLDDGWTTFHTDALPAVLAMSDEDESKATWLLLLQTLETDWTHLKSALQLAYGSSPLSQEQKQHLDSLQDVLDQIALRAVKDNTVRSRGAERDAWFRMFEILNTSTAAQLQERSEGRVGFLQLFKQPTTYRGKIVTVRGTARMAYRVRAPKNIYGIDNYYVFVLRPSGGPDSPLLAYSLEIPTGFPPIKDKQIDRGTTELDEELELTGFFFKNCAYTAQDGIRVAPLVLAKVPQWEPPSDPQPAGELPSTTSIITGLLGIGSIAILIAAVVYFQTRRTSSMLTQFGPTSLTHGRRLDELKKEELTPGISESLQQLASEISSTDTRATNDADSTDEQID